MRSAPRCMVVLRTHPEPQVEIDTRKGLRPLQNHLEIASMTNADIVSADTLAKRVGRRSWRGRFSAGAAAVAAFSIRNQYDAIYVTGEDIGLPLALMLRTAGWGGRLVVVVHACRGRRKALFKLIGHTPFHRLICVSRMQHDILTQEIGFPDHKVAIQPDSVDTEFFSPARALPQSGEAQDRQPYVFACGMENRDYDTLIAAMAGIPARLHIVASGIMAADAKGVMQRATAIADQVTVQQRVSYEELRRLYAGAELVVVPIHPVDYGAGVNGIMEAMAMAKVVIASDSPGIREYLIKDCSLTVPSHDPQALASAITELLNANEREKMGAAAREHTVKMLEIRQYVQSLSYEMLGASDYQPAV